MKTKTLLEICRKEKKEILILSEKIEQLSASALPKSIPMLQDRVQSSVEPDPMGERVAARIELKVELDRQLARMLEHDLEAHKAVSKIEDSTYRQILELYYLTFRIEEGVKSLHTWETVADELGYSVRQCFELRKEAMRCVK